MDLYLRFDQTDPPTGRLRRLPTPSPTTTGVERPDPEQPARYETVEFSGWLGLLRALSDVFDDATAPGGDVRDGGSTDAPSETDDDPQGERLR